MTEKGTQPGAAAGDSVDRPMKVAEVLDPFTVVVNKGSEHGLRVGQRVLIYAIGHEVRDPDTGESLGALELIKGTGKISHLQPRMAQVSSDMKTAPGRTIRRQASGLAALSLDLYGPVEETLPPKPVAFEDAATGDLVRII